MEQVTARPAVHWDDFLFSRSGAYAILLAVAVVQPGILLGGLVALLAWPRLGQRLRMIVAGVAVLGLGAAVAAVVVGHLVEWAWPWRLALQLPELGLAHAYALPWSRRLGISGGVEVLAGPAWGLGVLWLTPHGDDRRGTIEAEDRRDQLMRAAVQKPLADLHRKDSVKVPAQTLRLGTDRLTGKPFDIALPGGLERMGTVIGNTGSGKTTTILRVAEAALRAGWAVLVVDGKGGGLRDRARALSAAAALPYTELIPGQADGLHYNPARVGSPAQIANKLAGAFEFAPVAMVYQEIALATMPVVVRALQAQSSMEVTVRSIRDHLSIAGLQDLANGVAQRGHDAALTADLDRLIAAVEDKRSPSSSGVAGMAARLSSLLEGDFGAVFEAGPQLDLEAVTGRPGLSYVSLQTLASQADAALMARVLIGDLKQVAHRRLSQPELPHCLLILDEFAALGDPRQLEDLLLQAREARMPAMVGSQYLPEPIGLRRALLGVGLIICHQVGHEDAQAIADAFGTRSVIESTRSIDYGNGSGSLGSTHAGQRYELHPQALKALLPGCCAVKVEPGGRRMALVQVAGGFR
ncbi:MAG: hypothetical protein M3067_05910 [Chloroflexota bacterium]|nr:hypothetical protein [Chloroflexota bacterium]MDQ6898251.1 hypothetical protein [Candidatus Dormibacteraeota bacterium]